ncbi:MAG: hypothetical protein KKA73_06595 [Chloroflexi bacterium]|nr:hypothetical protein [Chloroflexota bacterium]MBU1747340.1 hypothetical protein [Chloroflexota bacterium]
MNRTRRLLIFAIFNLLTPLALIVALQRGWQPDITVIVVLLVALVGFDLVLAWGLERLGRR